MHSSRSVFHIDSKPTVGTPRPPIVDEYKRQRLAAARVKWRGFRVMTWVLTISSGLWLLLDPRNSPRGDPNADHVLKPFRDWFWDKYDALIVSDDELNASLERGRAKQATPSPPPDASPSNDSERVE